jgi:hypothetical protein
MFQPAGAPHWNERPQARQVVRVTTSTREFMLINELLISISI